MKKSSPGTVGVPLLAITAVPCPGGVAKPVMVRGSPLGSVSLASTRMLTGTPAAVVAVSGFATGGGLVWPAKVALTARKGVVEGPAGGVVGNVAAPTETGGGG